MIGTTVAYRSVTGVGVYDAKVLDCTIDDTLTPTVDLDVIVPGCREPVRRTKVPWTFDPGCTIRGTAHPRRDGE